MAVSILIGSNQEILSRSPGNVIECAQHSIMSRWISTPKKYQACKSIWDLYCNPHLIRPLIGLQCALDGILLLYSRHIFSLNKYTKKKNVNMRSSFLSLHSTIIIVLWCISNCRCRWHSFASSFSLSVFRSMNFRTHMGKPYKTVNKEYMSIFVSQYIQ